MNANKLLNATPAFIEPIYSELINAKKEFEARNAISGEYVKYAQEAGFAYQAAAESEKWGAAAIALATPESFINSFIRIAEVGLSIEPKLQLAHLKTKYNDGIDVFETHFEFNYRGYLKLISRSKIVKVISADVVYENDEFEFSGTREKVIHKVKSLSPSKRGEFAGGYCTSELIDGSIITTVMNSDEIKEIERIASEYDNNAWNSVFIDEMRRKTFIKRHWKTLATVVQSLEDNKVISTVESIHEAEKQSSNTKMNLGMQSEY